MSFIGLGLLALSMTMAPGGCLERLQWADAAYRADGSPAPQPAVGGETSGAVVIGQTLQGLTTRDVYAAAGEAPAPGSDERPERIALDCGDGTFQAYDRDP